MRDPLRAHPVLPAVLVFLATGVEDAVGPLAEGARIHFGLGHTVATLLPFTVFIAFALLSVPAGLLAARVGKRRTLLLGLGVNTLAVGIPALMPLTFPALVACIFLVGAGTTCLHVAANPLVGELSAPHRAARNLSLAHLVKGLGSVLCAYLAGAAVLWPLVQGLGWRAPFPFFVAIMVLCALGVLRLKAPEQVSLHPPSLRASLGLLREKAVALGVFASFLYVGSEVCLARFLGPTLQAHGFSAGAAALGGTTLFFAGLTGGRVLGMALLSRVPARLAYVFSGWLGLGGVLGLLSGIPGLAVPSVALAGLGFANLWPLIFTLTVEGRGARASEISGLLCMAISGGALLPLGMGLLMDGGLGTWSYLVPLAALGFLVVEAQIPRATT